MSEELQHVFDYGDIKPEHKEAVAEVISLLRSHDLGTIADMLKIRFKIQEIPKYDASTSPWVVACTEAGIYNAIQGFVQEGVEPNIIQYPLMAVCDDIRKLEKLVDVIKKMELNENTKD
jgi:hypothetical protein